MKRKTILLHGRRTALRSVCCLLLGAAMMQSCEDDVLTGQPSWLGNSIYERLQDEGNYTVMMQLIEDMGQKDVLSRTGSKTLFVADDQAFDQWFKTNTWGVREYRDLTVAQKKLLLNNAMVNNAYLIELLSNTSGNPPQQGKCMRRSTAASAYDSITFMKPEEMPATESWAAHRDGEGIYILKDGTNAPMIHFLPAFMRVNNITADDLWELTNHVSNSIEDSWVDGKRVTETDITCKNGYIQKVDGVIESAPNMAEILHQHSWPKHTRQQGMSMWSHLIDRFSAPFYVGSYNVTEANRQINIPQLYEMRYFANLTRYGKIEQTPDNKAVDATLTFDPGWNGYYDTGSTQSQGIANDAAVMFVPTDSALTDWWEHGGGNVLKEVYHYWDSIPDLVLSKLLNVNMKTSLVESVPSKFGSILDDAKMEMGIKPEHVDSCFMGCNGVVYLTNRVFTPREYSSVSFPALIHQDVMSIIYWAIDNLDFGPYLRSMESYYSFFIPTNDAMLTYIDPTTYGETRQILYRFFFDPSKTSDERVQASRYYVTRDPETDSLRLESYIGLASKALVKNRLEDLMNTLIVVGDVEDGHTFYKTKGGSVLRVENAGQEGVMTVSGGYQLENNSPLTVSKIYDQSATGNGKAYETDQSMIMGASKSVYQTLREHPEFTEFLNLLQGNDADSTKYNLLIKKSGSYSCANATGDNNNIRLFEKFNYTVYVPDSASIQKLISDGYLPTWDDYEAQTDDVWEDATLKAKARAAIRNRIFNFVRYHIQDNAVYIGGEPVNDVRYETSKLNLANNRFYSLLVNADDKNMKVTDQLGNTRSVDEELRNLTCREYWISGSGTGRSINSASDAVVHYIDGVLLFDNSLTSKTWQQELDELRTQN